MNLKNTTKAKHHRHTDKTDDEPTLPSHSDLPYLRPQPTDRYFTIRVIMRRVHPIVEAYPSVPLGDRVLYPVCQTPRRGGFSFRTCDGLARAKKDPPIVVKSSYFL